MCGELFFVSGKIILIMSYINLLLSVRIMIVSREVCSRWWMLIVC